MSIRYCNRRYGRRWRRRWLAVAVRFEDICAGTEIAEALNKRCRGEDAKDGGIAFGDWSSCRSDNVMRRFLIVVTVCTTVCACDHRDPAPPRDPQPANLITSPHRQMQWTGDGGGFLQWYSGGDYMYATSGKGAPLVDVWKWSGDTMIPLFSRVTAQRFSHAFIWNDRLFLATKRHDQKSLEICEHGAAVAFATMELGPYWYLSDAALSPDGNHVGMKFGEEPQGNPTYDSERHKVLLGLYNPGEKTFRRILMTGGSGGRYDYMIRRIRPSNNGRWLALAGWGNGVLVADMQKGEVLWEKRPPGEINATDVFWSADDKTIYSVGSEGCLYRYNAQTGEILGRSWATETGKSEYGWRISTVTVSADGRFMAAGTGPSGLVFLWDAKSGQRVSVYDHGGSTILLLSFSPDSKYLASFEGGAIKIWKLPEATTQATQPATQPTQPATPAVGRREQ